MGRQVGGVHGGGAGPQCSCCAEKLSGGKTVGRLSHFVLPYLLGKMKMQRQPVGLRPAGHNLGALGRDSPHGVDGRAQAGTGGNGAPRHLAHTFSPGLRALVGKAHLGALDGTSGGALEVAGVDERYPHAGVGRCRHQRLAHGIGVGVGCAPRAVMYIVELPHRRDPGQRHLRVCRPRQPEVVLGRERLRHPVHFLPPGPKGSPTGLRAASQRPVESVRVGVGKAGQRQAPQVNGVCGPGRPEADGGYTVALGRNEHVGLGRRTSDPGMVAKITGRRVHRTGALPGRKRPGTLVGVLIRRTGPR